MAKKTPEEIARKQVQRAQAAAQDYVDGVNGVTESPMAKAKAKKDKMRANTIAAIDDGTWERGLDSVSMDRWKELTAAKGSERYSTGIAAAEQDIVAFQQEIAPHREAVRREVQAMPDTTLEQRLARMAANARGMAKFKRTKRRR